jgi:hypothetical protein
MPRSAPPVWPGHPSCSPSRTLTCHERCSHSVLCLSRLLDKLFLTAGALLLDAQQENRMACLDTRNACIAPNWTWRRWFGPEVRAFRCLDLRPACVVQSADRETLCCCSVCRVSGKRGQCERDRNHRSRSIRPTWPSIVNGLYR